MENLNEDDLRNQAKVPDPLRFFLAGKAFFTLRSTKTGIRYTYRIVQATDKQDKPIDLWFVSFLTGPDNWANYSYIGVITADRKFKVTPKSKLPLESPPCQAISYAFTCLNALSEIPGVEVWHAGRCGMCGRMLTVPESIASGFGPECASRM